MIELEYFKLFVLVLARFSGLIVSAPILGSANFPMPAKAGLSALAALVLTPVLGLPDAPLPDETFAFAAYGAGEFLIGLLLGFVMTLVFAAIQLAGQVIDLQTGFGMMNVFNPALETQFPIFGFFLFIIGVLYLLVINGHHLMIQALVATYDHVPVGGFVARPALLLDVAGLGQGIFVEGLMLAAPLAAAMLLAYVTMGLLGRVVPQIHLFVVGFPLTIATSLFLLALSIGVYLAALDGMFGRMFRNVDALIRALG
ncbi:MAG TPA: flagellar biosynthetic protein FliR [Candidatus Hydrogenedentes bacterium]|nr:flagellar biosynthetic protein FliR [Candidatus Hydrogenedentota bacterium]HNT86610.1 flagellar biosynthetic protein FliR [Candidatus Hydrogenedentota bacterium]